MFATRNAACLSQRCVCRCCNLLGKGKGPHCGKHGTGCHLNCAAAPKHSKRHLKCKPCGGKGKLGNSWHTTICKKCSGTGWAK